MKRKVSFIILIAVLNLVALSFTVKEKTIYFARNIYVLNNCQGEESSFEIKISTDSKKRIKVHSFELDSENFVFLLDGKIYSKNTVFTVSRKQPLVLKVKHKVRNSNTKLRLFKFKTDNPNFLNNSVNVYYQSFIISHKEVREHKAIKLKISEVCNDTLNVYFPYGGTISGVSLYKDSTKIEKPYKSISYMLTDKKNYLKFTKSDVGKYYVRFSACHWSSWFWLIIEK